MQEQYAVQFRTWLLLYNVNVASCAHVLLLCTVSLSLPAVRLRESWLYKDNKKIGLSTHKPIKIVLASFWLFILELKLLYLSLGPIIQIVRISSLHVCSQTDYSDTGQLSQQLPNIFKTKTIITSLGCQWTTGGKSWHELTW